MSSDASSQLQRSLRQPQGHSLPQEGSHSASRALVKGVVWLLMDNGQDAFARSGGEGGRLKPDIIAS